MWDVCASQKAIGAFKGRFLASGKYAQTVHRMIPRPQRGATGAQCGAQPQNDHHHLGHMCATHFQPTLHISPHSRLIFFRAQSLADKWCTFLQRSVSALYSPTAFSRQLFLIHHTAGGYLIHPFCRLPCMDLPRLRSVDLNGSMPILTVSSSLLVDISVNGHYSTPLAGLPQLQKLQKSEKATLFQRVPVGPTYQVAFQYFGDLPQIILNS